MRQSIEALFTLSIKMHLGHKWTALNTAVTASKTGNANVLNTIHLALPNNLECNVWFFCFDAVAVSQQIKANGKRNPITSDYLRDFRCILMPGVNRSPCHLDLNKVWIWKWTLGLNRAWKRVEGDPAGMDPEVVLRPPHPPHPSQVPQWTPPCANVRDGGAQKDTGPSFYITSWHSLLLLLSALPCFRTGKGEDWERGAQILLSPSWWGVFSQQRVLFSCESLLGSECELRITPQWPRLTFAQSPMLNIARHYLKAVQIIIMIKTHMLNLCMHPQRQWKTMEKSD